MKPSVPSLSEHIHRSGEVRMIGSIRVIAIIATVILARKAMKAYHVRKIKKKKGGGGR